MTQPSGNSATFSTNAAQALPAGGEQAALTPLGAVTGAAMGSPTSAAITDNVGGGDAPDGTIAEIADIAIATAGGNTYADAATNTAVNALIDDIANACEELIAEHANNVLDVAVMKTDLDKHVTDVTAARVITNAALLMLQGHGIMAGGTQLKREDALVVDKTGRGLFGDLDSTAIADIAAATSGTVGALSGGAITDSSGGTNNATISVQTDLALSTSDTYTDAAVNTAVNAWTTEASNAVKSLSTAINAQRVDIAACKAELNKSKTDGATLKTPHDLLLDRLEAHGLKSGGTAPTIQNAIFVDRNENRMVGARGSSVTAPAAVTAAAVTATNVIVVDTAIAGGDTPDGTAGAIVDINLATGNSYTDAAVNSAVNAAVDDAANALEEIAAEVILMNADVADCIAQCNAVRVDYTANRTFLVGAVDALELIGLLADN